MNYCFETTKRGSKIDQKLYDRNNNKKNNPASIIGCFSQYIVKSFLSNRIYFHINSNKFIDSLLLINFNDHSTLSLLNVYFNWFLKKYCIHNNQCRFFWITVSTKQTTSVPFYNISRTTVNFKCYIHSIVDIQISNFISFNTRLWHKTVNDTENKS